MPDVAIPEIPITEYIFKDFRRFGDRPALINALTGEKHSFAQVRDAIWRTASGLTRHGIRKNDIVMIVSENSIEYVIASHAILSIGGTMTMANPQSTPNDILRQAVDSEAKFIITSLKCVSKALEVTQTLKNQVEKVFLFGEGHEDCIPFSVLLTDDGSMHSEHVYVDTRNHVAILPYSSGTTGLPKGVMLSHFIEVANAIQADNDYIGPVREGMTQLGVLPFYHIYAFMLNIIASLAWGQTTVVVPGFEPKLFLESIEKYRVNLCYLVPPIILFLNKHPMAAAADLSSLTRVASAAAPIGKEAIEEFCSRHKNCALGQGYGMTETGPVVSINPIDECSTKPSSCGKLVSMTEAKIVDIDDRSKELEVGQTGELCVRGPQMMLGYYKNPKATEDIIEKDGWLHTGDVGYIGSDNHIYVCDRLKELIKYKGLQVPPAELEAVLDAHPAVADACVVGIPHPEAGEVPKAFVALKRDASATKEELQQFVAERVSAYKKLRGGIEFIPEIPRSPAGKILRRLLQTKRSIDT